LQQGHHFRFRQQLVGTADVDQQVVEVVDRDGPAVVTAAAGDGLVNFGAETHRGFARVAVVIERRKEASQQCVSNDDVAGVDNKLSHSNPAT